MNALLFLVFPLAFDTEDGLRSSVASLGDVNGDLIEDIAVVGRAYDSHHSIWIVSGRDGTMLAWIDARQKRGGVGRAIDRGGDLDGDGSGDLIVSGADEWTERSDEPGIGIQIYRRFVGQGFVAAYSSRSGTMLWRAEGPAGDGRFGWSIAGGHDLDRDRVADVLASDATEACVDVLSGRDGQRIRRLPVHRLETARPARLGASSATAAFGPDFDRDGVPECLVGSSQTEWCGHPHLEGVIAVHSGANGERLRLIRSTDTSGGFSFGWQLGGAGDIDGDGWTDLFGAAEDGYLALISGRDFGELRRIPWRHGMCYSLGSSISAIGDVDGDGCAEIAVGANHSTRWLFQCGLAIVYSGTTGERIRETRDGYQGLDVCALDDVDDDGAAELVIHRIERRRVDVVNARTFAPLYSVDLAPWIAGAEHAIEYSRRASAAR